MKTNYKKLALAGIIGGLVCMLANWVIYFGTTNIMTNPDPFWDAVASQRYAVSEVLIVLGVAGCLGGFVSIYQMVKENCGKGLQALAAFGAVGIAGTALAHGNFGCAEPLVYKILMENKVSSDVYLQIDSIISSHFGWVDVLVVVASITQVILVAYLVLSGKAKVSKWMVLCNFIVTFVLAFLINNLLNNAIGCFILGGAKSFGEAIMYAVPYLYWKQKENA